MAAFDTPGTPHEDTSALADAGDLAEPRGGVAGDDPGEPGRVTRAVEVDAGADEVWRAVADPDQRTLWLDDPDAAARRVRIDESAPGERLVWTWWHPGGEGDASTVTVELAPTVGGGTRVTVTEAVPAVAPGVVAQARATADAGRTCPAAVRSPSWIRCGRDRWDARLLGLELLFVAARAGVA